ncbi:hypothetical protein [Brevibacillus reuszeri]|uniref:hypothetical protein n=1 Tax=Brevibacillus reuszeri TaxID=54915 RepID=UPI003D1FBFE4
MASISPNSHIPLPGTPLYQLLSQGIGSAIEVRTIGGEIKGKLTGITTGVISLQTEDASILHIVFQTVISFSFVK